MEKSFQRFVVRLFYPVMRAYWFIVRPACTGAKCVIQNNNAALLIRHSYIPDVWALPGGRVERGETPSAAVVREVHEELGLTIEPLFLTTVYTEREYKKNTIHLFTARSEERRCTLDDVEIIDAQWFERGNLPANVGWTTRQALKAIQFISDDATVTKEYLTQTRT